MLVALAGAATWWWARASLPILDGQLTLPGLQAPVEVLIDGYGVPSVYASDNNDAWFVVGVLHARERLWQMELYRRVTLGRLSEIFGERTLPIDKRFLTLGLRAAAEAEWQRANPAVRAALDRYSAGVNAAAGAMIGRQRPLEFQLLRITPRAVDAGRFARGRLAAGVAAGRESSIGARARRSRRALRGGEGAAIDRQISGECADDHLQPLQSRDSKCQGIRGARSATGANGAKGARSARSSAVAGCRTAGCRDSWPRVACGRCAAGE